MTTNAFVILFIITCLFTYRQLSVLQICSTASCVNYRTIVTLCCVVSNTENLQTSAAQKMFAATKTRTLKNHKLVLAARKRRFDHIRFCRAHCWCWWWIGTWDEFAPKCWSKLVLLVQTQRYYTYLDGTSLVFHAIISQWFVAGKQQAVLSIYVSTYNKCILMARNFKPSLLMGMCVGWCVVWCHPVVLCNSWTYEFLQFCFKLAVMTGGNTEVVLRYIWESCDHVN